MLNHECENIQYFSYWHPLNFKKRGVIMSLSIAGAFLAYTFITALTPGPNNISGSELRAYHGFHKAYVHWLAWGWISHYYVPVRPFIYRGDNPDTAFRNPLADPVRRDLYSLAGTENSPKPACK